MPVYQYRARDSSGAVTEGVIQASDRAEAVNKLRSGGLWVTQLHQQREPVTPAAGFPRTAPLSLRDVLPFIYPKSKDLAFFFRTLHTLLKAGVRLYEAFTSMSKQTPHWMLKNICRQVADQLMEGKKLSDQLARYPDIFPEFVVAIVETGEKSGRLEQMLDLLARHYEHTYENELEFKRRTFYPKLLIFFFVLYILFVPAIIAYFVSGGAASQQRLAGSLHQLIQVAVGLFVLYIAWRSLHKTWGARYALDLLKMNMPGISGIFKRISEARLCRTLATMYASGIGLPVALTYAGRASGNEILNQLCQWASFRVKEGEKLSDVLAERRTLMPVTLQMIQTGEQTGNLDMALEKAAEFYENEAKTALVTRAIVLGVVLFLMIAVIIGYQVITSWVSHYTGIIGGLTGE